MDTPTPTPLQRFLLAFYALFAVLFRREVASAVYRLYLERRDGGAASSLPAPAATPAVGMPSPPAPRPAPEPAPAAPELRTAGDARGALYVLGLLQREGRLLDFVEEDVSGFPDATIGAAARTVHEGCRRALRDLVRLDPVLGQPEGAQVTVERGFDPAAIRLTGAVVGAPPFRGALRHHGWRAREVTVPPAQGGMDAAVLAPAEVEL
jgi:hypothetical protein